MYVPAPAHPKIRPVKDDAGYRPRSGDYPDPMGDGPNWIRRLLWTVLAILIAACILGVLGVI